MGPEMVSGLLKILHRQNCLAKEHAHWLCCSDWAQHVDFSFAELEGQGALRRLPADASFFIALVLSLSALMETGQMRANLRVRLRGYTLSSEGAIRNGSGMGIEAHTGHSLQSTRVQSKSKVFIFLS